MTYNLLNYDQGVSDNGKYIRFGIGSDKRNGEWYTLTRDLASDLKKFEPDNELIEVNGLLVRGSGRIDNVMMLNLVLDTVYEDAQDRSIDGWVVYDADPTGATISNVYDSLSDSFVIEFTGEGTSNGYRLGSSNSTDSNAWGSTRTVIQWDARFDREHHGYYVAVQTLNGFRYMTYNLASTDLGISSNGKYVRFGLGSEKKNGEWHTITRDLNLDLQSFEPENRVIEVNGFLLRGSGRIDNIKMKASLPPVTPIDPEDSVDPVTPLG